MAFRCRPELLVCFSLLFPLSCNGFDFPNIFKPPSFGPTTSSASPSAKDLKAAILRTVSGTNNGKDAPVETQQQVLSLVRKLETKIPISSTILTDSDEAKILDGRWFLQYTSPSELSTDEDAWVPENASEDGIIEVQKGNNRGSVSASGIQVDTANRVTTQSFDVAKGRVENYVEQDFGAVVVGGSFRVSDSVPNRAVVAFDDGAIKFNNGLPTIPLGWIFSLLAIVRGTKDAGWLETTYCDTDTRIGRGNKGTLFVLTRERDAVRP